MKASVEATQDSSQPPERLLRLQGVLDATGLSKAGLYRLIRAQEFPASIRLTTATVAWPASAVSAWIAQRIADGARQQVAA